MCGASVNAGTVNVSKMAVDFCQCFSGIGFSWAFVTVCHDGKCKLLEATS